jgi:hypothetical protein
VVRIGRRGVLYLDGDLQAAAKAVLIRAGFDSSPAARAGDEHEARLLAGLQHPGLPAVLARARRACIGGQVIAAESEWSSEQPFIWRPGQSSAPTTMPPAPTATEVCPPPSRQALRLICPPRCR